jgi:ADP-ribose pyrophosphatase YjhB (NUDIX family)
VLDVLHPLLSAALCEGEPVKVIETAWGELPLRISAHTTTPQLPLELISSVRCIVRVGQQVVVCENADGVQHPWPGGRREAGESFADTAVREVHEETGWLIDRESLRQLGWLRLTHLGPRRPGGQGPYPDFLQVVFTATATGRDGDAEQPWTDLDGYEVAWRLATLDEAAAASSRDELARVFLRLLGGEQVAGEGRAES